MISGSGALMYISSHSRWASMRSSAASAESRRYLYSVSVRFINDGFHFDVGYSARERVSFYVAKSDIYMRKRGEIYIFIFQIRPIGQITDNSRSAFSVFVRVCA